MSIDAQGAADAELARDEFVVMGTVATGLPPESLMSALQASFPQLQVRESAHMRGGRYLRLASGDMHLSLERATDAEYLVRADAPDRAALQAACVLLSAALTQLRLLHRLELYGTDEQLLQEWLHLGQT